MFYKIGHRGAAGHSPENTLNSFKKALSLNVNMIELDTHICKSGEVVVFHNRSTKKISNTHKLIKNQDYPSLKKLNIPNLKNVLDLINREVKVNIELKGKKTAQPVAKIIKKYIRNKKWQLDDFLISSFNKKELKEFSKHLPKVRLGYLVGPLHFSSFWIKRFPFIFKRHLKFAKQINAFSINIHHQLVNKKIIEMAHRENFKIFVYTLNHKREIEKFKNMGINGIFSDYPDRI